tara:strand:- start:2808 stop:3119 length:312 start_codon:yes stop_codon:yes gene_type:complete
MTFPELKPIDTGPIDEAMAALNEALGVLKRHKELDEYDAIVMEKRFTSYVDFIADRFKKGFIDGYLTAHYENEDESEAYHSGFKDGYAYSQMLDGVSNLGEQL